MILAVSYQVGCQARRHQHSAALGAPLDVDSDTRLRLPDQFALLLESTGPVPQAYQLSRRFVNRHVSASRPKGDPNPALLTKNK